ncbi:hypothetical protein BJY01DRAFT_248091 [Aspergillus pseudoustus]|uniref:Uncharacterized protein n=1 Tax=Aspergillus pseudoustus TaxID=1810923 RepID=A0ABR4JX10_9EURO
MNRASQRVTSEAVKGQLEMAICLLAFALKRLLDEEGTEALKSVNDIPDLGDLPEPESGEDPEESSEVEGEEDHLLAGDINDNITGELEELDFHFEMEADEEQYRTELQNKVLDRLAETLARFKSRPGFPDGLKVG